MGVALLKRRFANFANLNLPKSTTYEVVAFDKKNPKLTETAITALEEAAKDKRLTCAGAQEIMERVRLRDEFGDYPDATLSALDDIATTKSPEPWHDKTTKALKAKKPEKQEEAEAITLGVLQEHVAGIYRVSNFPEFEKEYARYILETLAAVPANDRQRVYLELCKAKAPITEAMAHAILNPPPASSWPVPAPSSTTDAPPAAPTTSPERTTGNDVDPAKTAEDRKGHHEETEEETEEVCDYCKKPGTLGVVTNGDGRQARLHRECEAPWLAKKESDPKAIIKACLDEVVPAIRVAFASLDSKDRLILVDEIRKAISGLMREVTARDADTNHWTEPTHLGAAQ
jgi:hypothetical protein